LDKTITITEALTSCSLDEAARLSAASDLRDYLQRQADKKAGG
jgi:hypothetical protein